MKKVSAALAALLAVAAGCRIGGAPTEPTAEEKLRLHDTWQHFQDSATAIRKQYDEDVKQLLAIPEVKAEVDAANKAEAMDQVKKLRADMKALEEKGKPLSAVWDKEFRAIRDKNGYPENCVWDTGALKFTCPDGKAAETKAPDKK